MKRPRMPADAVGIQVPVGRILADRHQWQTVFDARSKPSIYRIYNGSSRSPVDASNAMIVEVDGAKRTITVRGGTSIDILAKRIRVRAHSGATSPVEGWYVLVS